MEVIQMTKSGAATAERQVAVRDAPAENPAAPAPAPREVTDAIAAGVVSRRMLFPEDGPPRTLETWKAPVIEDKAVGAAVWARLAALDAWMAPADRPRLMSRILVLLAHYRSTQHADAVEQGIADDWAEDLAVYPMWAINEAARTWHRTRKFRPQISEIIELCEAATATSATERGRLRAMGYAAARGKNPLAARADHLASGLLKRIG